MCDAGALPGCLSNCLGVSIGYSCISVNSPSICSPICGDGIVVGIEKCDDGNKGGCLSDCSGP